MIKKLMPLLLIGILLIGIGCIGPFAEEEPDDKGPFAEEEPDDNGENNWEESDAEVILYYFWGDGCPVCPSQEEIIDQIEQEYDEEEFEIRKFEVYYNQRNLQLFQQVTEIYEVRGAVPATFIGEESYVGLTQKSELENKINQCLETEECEDPIKEIM